MVLQETETQVQTALSDTILTTFQKTIKYQTEFSVEGLIRVVVDKKDIYTFNINERIEKGKEVERLLSASSDSKSPTKRKRGRPRKSQKLAESESDEDAFDDFPGEQEDDDEEDLDDSGAKVGDEKTDEQNIVKQEPLGFDMAGGDGSQKQAEAGSQVFSQEDTALQLQQLALQLAGVSSDLAMQQPEIPASSAATPGTATDPSQPDPSDLKASVKMEGDILEPNMTEKEAYPKRRRRGRRKRTPNKVEKKDSEDKVCPVCGKKFKKEYELNSHLNSHLEIKPYKCSFCETRFCRENARKKHERLQHLGEKAETKGTPDAKITCPVCARKFRSEANLEGHMNIHLEVKPFPCAFCDKRFCRENAKKKHERMHTGEKPYQCSRCGMMFTYEGQLKKHEICHTGEKPYKCSFCDKRFAWAEQIKIHERIHTGERPYQCSFCGKTFAIGEHLRRHERLHTGERPFKCGFCPKAFAQEANLKSHERIHTGDKPYNCSYCDKRFNQHGHLKSHERTHTGEKPFKCAFCDKRYSDPKSKKKHEARLCPWRTYTNQGVGVDQMGVPDLRLSVQDQLPLAEHTICNMSDQIIQHSSQIVIPELRVGIPIQLSHDHLMPHPDSLPSAEQMAEQMMGRDDLQQQQQQQQQMGEQTVYPEMITS